MPPQENQATDQFSQIVDRLKEANNVLVTVQSSPSVDQLAACIALTVALNKIGKHATAVFSGVVPSTIEFLEPEKTLESNTDSLRDFIISLDKSKADKLRYKVEDSVVKIFITPYKTSISDQDLDFSQGDFNVDAVVALGVHDRNELDQAILAHGRILHDATVTSVNIIAGPELGSINWLDTASSSLCEMVSDLVDALDKSIIDSQIATALLTGVVAETDRFRNEKATPHTMSVSGTLMAAGASTQLVATKLEEVPEPSDEIPEVVEADLDPENEEQEEEHEEAGTIQIDHAPDDDIHIDQAGQLHKVAELEAAAAELEQEAVSEEQPPLPEVPTELEQPQVSEAPAPDSNMILTPPSIGGQLTANSVPEQYDPSTDPLGGNLGTSQILSHQSSAEPAGDKTLLDIEKSLNSPHVAESAQPLDVAEVTPPVEESVPPPPEPDYARDAVQRAVDGSQDYRPEPTAAVGSTPVDLDLGHLEVVEPEPEQPADSASPPPPPVPPPMTPQQ